MLGPQEGSDLVPERCWCCLSWEGMGLDRGLENPVTPGSLGSGLEKQKGCITEADSRAVWSGLWFVGGK